METFFNSDYFRYVRFSAKQIGMWPFDDENEQRIKRRIVFVFSVLYTMLQVWTLITLRDDLESAIASLPYVISSLIITLKYYTCYLKYNMVKRLFVAIGENWMELRCKKEISVMEKYTHQGCLYTSFFTWFTVLSCLAIASVGLIVLFFQQIFIDSANNIKLLVPPWIYGDFLDFKTSMILFCCLFVVLIGIMLATDLVYITLVYHACAMLNVTGHKLQHLFDDVREMDANQKNSLLRKRVANAVRYHWKCMQYISDLESCYTVSLFLQHFMITIVITSKLYRIYRFSLTGRMNLIIICVDNAYTFVLLFANVYPAERLIECGQNLYHNAYNGFWYDTPASTQKVVQIILQKISEPLSFGISGLFSASFETCSKILQFSFSCFTVICTIRA